MAKDAFHLETVWELLTRLKDLHWMRCAKCGAELQEVEFKGVKVDKCFSCGGVYLDDGELEQLAGRPGWFDSMLKIFRTTKN